MKAVVQRVSSAAVVVERETVGAVDAGLMVLLGVGHGDDAAAVRWMADKLVGLRIFEDDDGKMNRSLLEVGGQMLVVSQFTLFGDCKKGRRPSFVDAAPPELAERLYEEFVAAVRAHGVTVGTGRFRTHMEVSLTNDGPVTLIVESP
ncbi:D-tyrosyl-tRNA(Tyr) deacylase [Posidoniimonas corsicana]|uniref:D-aminoacyl-tRNA deacylase n=1 Tax=Posidoniimonas corsicana TaxID=1938618 RepID=A0A5C5V6U6_9BACT|nr:D-tyrosyl-tRNA(Tyr) deacylase [Posidoniimonas corsicana]